MSDEIKVEQTTAEEVAATAAEETAHVEAEPAAEICRICNFNTRTTAIRNGIALKKNCSGHFF